MPLPTYQIQNRDAPALPGSDEAEGGIGLSQNLVGGAVQPLVQHGRVNLPEVRAEGDVLVFREIGEHGGVIESDVSGLEAEAGSKAAASGLGMMR